MIFCLECGNFVNEQYDHDSETGIAGLRQKVKNLSEERDCYQNMLTDIRTYILRAYAVQDIVPMSTVRGWFLMTCHKHKVDPDKFETEND